MTFLQRSNTHTLWLYRIYICTSILILLHVFLPQLFCYMCTALSYIYTAVLAALWMVKIKRALDSCVVTLLDPACPAWSSSSSARRCWGESKKSKKWVGVHYAWLMAADPIQRCLSVSCLITVCVTRCQDRKIKKERKVSQLYVYYPPPQSI